MDKELDEMEIEGLYELVIVKPYKRKDGKLIKGHFRNYSNKVKGVGK